MPNLAQYATAVSVVVLIISHGHPKADEDPKETWLKRSGEALWMNAWLIGAAIILCLLALWSKATSKFGRQRRY